MTPILTTQHSPLTSASFAACLVLVPGVVRDIRRYAGPLTTDAAGRTVLVRWRWAPCLTDEWFRRHGGRGRPPCRTCQRPDGACHPPPHEAGPYAPTESACLRKRPHTRPNPLVQ